MNRLTITALTLALIFGLTNCGSRRKEPSKSARPFSRKALTLADNWKTDPLGCRGIRTTQLAEDLSDEIWEHKNKNEVYLPEIIKMLGAPDYTRQINNFHVIGYYYNAACIDGMIPDGEEFCTFDFFFETELDRKKLHEWGPVCE